MAGVGVVGVGLVSIRENGGSRLCDDRNSNFDKKPNDDRISNGRLYNPTYQYIQISGMRGKVSIVSGCGWLTG